jgi:hypothetical protein
MFVLVMRIVSRTDAGGPFANMGDSSSIVLHGLWITAVHDEQCFARFQKIPDCQIDACGESVCDFCRFRTVVKLAKMYMEVKQVQTPSLHMSRSRLTFSRRGSTG